MDEVDIMMRMNNSALSAPNPPDTAAKSRPHARSRKWVLLAGLCAVAGCSENMSPATTCAALAKFPPASLTLFVGDVVSFSTTTTAGCPISIVRNETPAIIQVDSVALATYHVKGLAKGTGRIRVIAAADTTVSGLLTVTVQ
jgi:hypothetical protein